MLSSMDEKTKKRELSNRYNRLLLVPRAGLVGGGLYHIRYVYFLHKS